MTLYLADSTDISKLQVYSKVNLATRQELGQVFTPANLARFMAKKFTNISGNVRLLDAGAGVGTLTAAFVEQLLTNPEVVKSCYLVAYEVEAQFIYALEQCLIDCCNSLNNHGIQADYILHNQNFIQNSITQDLPLFSQTQMGFTHVILNPPYKKINASSIERKFLSNKGIDTVNLYSAFVWLAMLELQEAGELVAITPRSFCNGSYYLPFRRAFLEKMSLQKIHLFESRSLAFTTENILQENIIFSATKTITKPSYIEISYNSDTELDEISEIRLVKYQQIIHPHDEQQFIHINANSLADSLELQMQQFPCSLEKLGLAVSTGPVVDFRLTASLRNNLGVNTVPLIYPEALKKGQIIFPPHKPRKAIAIENNAETAKWLIKSAWYVIVKRFSSKEEKSRLVAAVCPPLDAEILGIENHLNYYHAQGKGINPDLARGLTAFLNSTLLDNYFRQFSGHTQVNATDLRQLRYPRIGQLIELGQKIGDSYLEQQQIDQLVHTTLEIMDEAKKAVVAQQKIQEALTILKAINAPREQQNERSALCLLALADIQPETDWQQAEALPRRITEMMNWFRDYYGKHYAPNTRETVRRQTMHQFVQMGLARENPDQPERPINSPKWCYQLTPETLSLLRAYNLDNWQIQLKQYLQTVTNSLQDRQRNIPRIPITLPTGKTLSLSSGGQNQLIKAILEEFCPRFTPSSMILYIGDAENKFIIKETKQLQELGLNLDPHGKMPDIVVHYQAQNWLVLVEAVTSHGPINLKRRNELQSLFELSNLGLVFVTAFPSRKEMVPYLAEISWETEVWLAEQPDHLIHFNGERFLGPYQKLF
jgi:adenine-specific DNA-methyltransferase